jgi:hypothetical protein
MPSLWEKMFKPAPPPVEFELPDDGHIDREMARVNAINAAAAEGVHKAVARQKDDTRIIRSVIDSLVERQRVERMKPTGDR